MDALKALRSHGRSLIFAPLWWCSNPDTLARNRAPGTQPNTAITRASANRPPTSTDVSPYTVERRRTVTNPANGNRPPRRDRSDPTVPPGAGGATAGTSTPR